MAIRMLVVVHVALRRSGDVMVVKSVLRPGQSLDAPRLGGYSRRR
jgi:hypothetical protein